MASGKDPVTRPNGGSGRSHQIEAEIDQTRAAMDRTVDLIAGKLTPQQLAVEAMGVFKDGSSALATKVIQTAREHPLPATIIGIGIGLLFTESRKGASSERGYDGDRGLDRQVGFGGPQGRYETGRYETGRYATSGLDGTGYETGGRATGGYAGSTGAYVPARYDGPQDTSRGEGVVSGALHSVSHAAGSVAGSVKHTASEVKDTVHGVTDTVALGAMEAKDRVVEKASHVKEQAGHVTEQVREQADHLRDRVSEGAVRVRESVAERAGAVREQAARVPVQARQQWHDAKLGFWQTMDQRPFAIGIAALAVGMAAGLSVPGSRKEQELMGETRDRLLDQAKGYTREAVDMGKQVARATADTVKSEVERQGLTPAKVAEKVRTIGREAEQALKNEVNATGPMTGGVAGGSSTGGAAGRGMSAGFASTSPSSGGRDIDSTVPGSSTTGSTDTKNRT